MTWMVGTKLIGTHPNGTTIEIVPMFPHDRKCRAFNWSVGHPDPGFEPTRFDWMTSEFGAKREAMENTYAFTRGQGRFRWERIKIDPSIEQVVWPGKHNPLE